MAIGCPITAFNNEDIEAFFWGSISLSPLPVTMKKTLLQENVFFNTPWFFSERQNKYILKRDTSLQLKYNICVCWYNSIISAKLFEHVITTFSHTLEQFIYRVRKYFVPQYSLLLWNCLSHVNVFRERNSTNILISTFLC